MQIIPEISGLDLLDNDMFKLSIYPPAVLQVQGGKNLGSHLLLHLDLSWDLDLQRNLKYLSLQYIFPAMEIFFSICMHRVPKMFKHSFLKHCFINIQFLQVVSETMTFNVVHPTVNLSIFTYPFVTYSCYLCCASNCMTNFTGSQATFSIWYWYWCEGATLTELFVSPICELFSPDDSIRTL